MKSYPNKKCHRELFSDDLWFNAGSNPGAYRFDGENLTYLAFPIEEDKNNYKSYGVTGVSKGNQGTTWISTYSALFGFDGENFQTINDRSLGYFEQSNLLHIRSILEDSKGRVWIGNNGIGVLLHQDDTTVNFF